MMRRYLSGAAAVICGGIILADFVVALPWLHTVAGRLLEGGLILAAFALLLGMLNLLAHHAAKTRAPTKNRWQSWIILLTLPVVFLLGMLRPASEPVRWIYTYIISPSLAALGALLLFYAVGAAWQIFRVRNFLAVILLVSSLLFLLLWIPGISSLHPLISSILIWMTAVPVGAGMRGILLGTAIGMIISALRVLSGIKDPFSGIEGKR